MKNRVLAQVRDAVVTSELSAATRGHTEVLGAGALTELARGVRADMYGAGPLQQFLEQPGVTDVLVNGPDEVWVDSGAGLQRVPLHLGTEDQVRALAVRLAAAAGRRLDDAQPAVDARLADGVRLHAILPPLAPKGTTLSLRVPSAKPLTLANLVAQETVPKTLEPVLKAVLGRRISFLISGATGTGKTTLLAALLGLVAPGERLIIIEEAQELSPQHPHLVHLQTRGSNVEGAGRVELSDLVRHALRMRPDRIVLGECRGAEIRELLTAFNTGHEGGGTTLHANAPGDVPARLQALGALAGMDQYAVSTQAASAIRVILHLKNSGGRRWLSDIAVLSREPNGNLVAKPAWQVTADGNVVAAAAARELTAQLQLIA